MDSDVFRLFGVLMAVGGAGTLIYAAVTIVSAISSRFGGRNAAVNTEALDEIRARLEVTEALEARVMELEERVDFAERLLAQPRDADGLPVTGHQGQA
jgi:hypothetical protein